MGQGPVSKRLILSEVDELHNAKAERNLAHFIKLAWKILEPETPLIWNWHNDLVCEYLTAAHMGQIKRLIINQPPRTTKSITATVGFPCWVWRARPETRFLFGSYAESLAKKHSLLRRNVLESDWYLDAWGHLVKLSLDQNVKTDFTNTKTGQMLAAGILGSITGEGGDYVLIDDPHNPKKAESEAERESAIESFDLAWSSRLNDKKTGRIIVIMQRLHEKDLTGHLLEKNAGYEHVCLPSIAEKRVVIQYPLSGKTKVREEGDLLNPRRDGRAELDQARTDLGSYGFAGQHQQAPAPRKGGMFQRDWWKYYQLEDLPESWDQLLDSWDLAFEGEDTSDYVVCQVWGRSGAKKFLLYQFREKLDFPKTLKQFRKHCKERPDIKEHLVEKKANGAALISTCKHEISGIIPINPTESKEQRASDVTPDVESGNVFLPHPSIAPWIEEFVDRFSKFPRVKYKDEIDTATQALSRMSRHAKLNKTVAFVSTTKSSVWRS